MCNFYKYYSHIFPASFKYSFRPYIATFFLVFLGFRRFSNFLGKHAYQSKRRNLYSKTSLEYDENISSKID